MLLPVLGKSALYIWFEINQNYVAEKYCVNKEREDCKGCCYLNEQIEKIDANNEHNPITNQKNTTQKKDASWDYLLNFTPSLATTKSKQVQFQLYSCKQHGSQYLAEINKPPCWVNSII
jgi:hypothetical protein